MAKKKGSLASWLVIAGAFFIPLINFIVKLVYYKRLRIETVSPGYWRSIWLNSWNPMAIFLLPLGIVLAASLVTQLEFKNNTWKQLHSSPQKFSTVFFAKFSVIIVMVLQFFVLFNIGIYLSGVIPCLLVSGVSYPEASIPWLFFLKQNGLYLIACLPMIALQFLISLQFKNFLLPVGAGIVLWILSVIVLSWRFGYLVPYTYCAYNFLQSAGRMQPPFPFYTISVLYFIIFTIAGYFLYLSKKKKDN